MLVQQRLSNQTKAGEGTVVQVSKHTGPTSRKVSIYVPSNVIAATRISHTIGIAWKRHSTVLLHAWIMKAESWQWSRAPSSHQDRILNVRLNLERQVYESLLVGLGIGSPVTSFPTSPTWASVLLAGVLEVLKRVLLNHS